MRQGHPISPERAQVVIDASRSATNKPNQEWKSLEETHFTITI